MNSSHKSLVSAMQSSSAGNGGDDGRRNSQLSKLEKRAMIQDTSSETSEDSNALPSYIVKVVRSNSF